MGIGDLSPMFLGAGALLSITGGVGVCCYNCKWYDEYGTYRLQYKGLNGPVASSALCSGIFGVLQAIAAIAAIAVLLLGLGKVFVVIAFAIVAVLYLGLMIPEAFVLDKTQYGGYDEEGNIDMNVWVPYEKRNWGEDKEWLDWVTTWGIENEKLTDKFDEMRNDMKDQKYADKLWYGKLIVEGALDSIGGYNIADAKYYKKQDDEYGKWTDVMVGLDWTAKPCLIDYTASGTNVLPLSDASEPWQWTKCEEITIETTECVGGWSAKKLENAIIDWCQEAYERALQTLLEESKDEKLWGKEEKASYVAKLQKEYIHGSKYTLPSLRFADSIFLAVQTVGFVLVVVGIVFFFIGGEGAKVSKE